jgi:hypothetical protein
MSSFHLSSKRARAGAVSPVIEGLEGRCLLSASPAHLDHRGVLRVLGTGHDDVITISPDAQQAGDIDVAVNGKVTTFQASQVQKIMAWGGRGNDVVDLDPSLNQPATLVGGAGNDSLVGDAGDDSLLGGAGDDTLVGSTGNDTLNAGTGDDSIEAGAGDDHVLGGTGHDSIDCGSGNDQVQLSRGGGVAASQLPTAVASGLTTLAKGGTIGTVQTFNEDGQTFYATDVIIAGKLTRIAVDANGNPVTDTPENHGAHHNGNQQNSAFGTLVSADIAAGTITLATASEHGPSSESTFTLASGATVTLNGAASTLGALPTGVWVGLQLDPASPTTAKSVNAIGKRTEGTLTAIDTTANTFTVTLEESTTVQTFTLAGNAIIEANGSAAMLATLPLGSKVEFRLSAVDGKTVTALEVGTGGSDHGGGSDSGASGSNDGGGDHSGSHHGHDG